MKSPHLALVKSPRPDIENGPVTRGSPPRQHKRPAGARKHLTETEVEKLVTAAGNSRYALRDQLMVFMAYRHGLRVKELVKLKWTAVHLDDEWIQVWRAKDGLESRQDLCGRERSWLRKWQRQQYPKSDHVFTSERGTPFKEGGFRTLIARLGKAAGIEFHVRPHMLRHACGYALVNKGIDTRRLQEYLGHKNIQHTVVYSRLSPTRLRNIWGD